jgi:hypothetical protein
LNWTDKRRTASHESLGASSKWVVRMSWAGRSGDYLFAAGLAIAAFVISPLGIKLISGRLDLSFRIVVISLTFDLFLVALLAAVLTRGRLRRACFYVLAVLFPLALLAGLEAAAVSLDLANRIAPLEDTSLYSRKRALPPHLLSDAHTYTTEDGLKLYRPWRGDGIVLNTLGLRATMPTPKMPGEWRIAITGGSAVWGFRVLDADTIPVRLQNSLRRNGHPNVAVYNFGIVGATVKQELALLKRFRETYAIDQAVFYTGGNDVVMSYRNAVNLAPVGGGSRVDV